MGGFLSPARGGSSSQSLVLTLGPIPMVPVPIPMACRRAVMGPRLGAELSAAPGSPCPDPCIPHPGLCRAGAVPAGTDPANPPGSTCGKQHEPNPPGQCHGDTVGREQLALCQGCPCQCFPEGAGWDSPSPGGSGPLRSCMGMLSTAQPCSIHGGRIRHRGPGRVPGWDLTLATSNCSHHREGHTVAACPDAAVRGSCRGGVPMGWEWC